MAKLDRILDRYDMKTLEAAIARRRARDKQLTAVAARRREVEAELAKLSAMMGNGSTGPGRRSRTTPTTRKPNARRLNKITLAEAMEKAMRAAKKPVHYKDLTDTILKRGLYRTKSKNLLTTVAITLKRDGRFKKTGTAVWALKKRYSVGYARGGADVPKAS